VLFRALNGNGFANNGPHYGWNDLAAGGVEVHDVPGTHNSMVQEPHVRALAEKLEQCLDRAWHQKKVPA
jgi:thioesterase domain-containing protein